MKLTNTLAVVGGVCAAAAAVVFIATGELGLPLILWGAGAGFILGAIVAVGRSK